MGECQCSINVNLLGDGCRYCQPQLALDKYIEQAGDLIAENEALEMLVSNLTAELAACKQMVATACVVAQEIRDECFK